MKKNILLFSILLFTFYGCGLDSDGGSGSGQSSLKLETNDIKSSFTITMLSKGMGTGKDNPYMVSYGIIDKEKIKAKSSDQYGSNTGYEAVTLSKNAGNNGTTVTLCTQSSISQNDYIKYRCDTTLTNGTKLSNELVLMMDKTYVLYLQDSFMWQDGIAIATDEKIQNITEIKF